MKPGIRTTELAVALVSCYAIVRMATLPIVSLGDGIARGCACLAVGWVAGTYARVRTEAKRGA